MDADDRDRNLVQADLFAERRSVASKAPGPEAVADHSHHSSASYIVRDANRPARDGRDSRRFVEVSGDHLAPHQFRVAVYNGDDPATYGLERKQTPNTLAVPLQFSKRCRRKRGTASRVRSV